MKQDERNSELMGRAVREVDPVPAAPREEMWLRIQAQRASQPSSEAGNDRGAMIELRPRERRTTWIRWSTAIAATLVVGVGLGRISSLGAPEAVEPVRAAAEPAEEIPMAYRVAATQHLARTETLLASLAVDGRTRGPGEISEWASELLTDTQLLLGSPAADDPATRRLLQDLDLVLSQIAAIPEARAEQEVELIQEGINQSDVLLRLHAATAGPRLAGT